MHSHYEINWLHPRCLHRSIVRRVGTNRNIWHASSDDNCLRLIAPPDGYAVVDVAHLTVAERLLSSSTTTLFPLPRCTTFEPLAVQLSLGAVHFVILLVYRPCSEEVSSLFFMSCRPYLRHWSRLRVPSSSAATSTSKSSSLHGGARRMRELLTYFEMFQHVKGPTHNRGNTLDLVITPSTCPLNGVDIEPAGRSLLSSLVRRSQSSACRRIAFRRVERLVRGFRHVWPGGCANDVGRQWTLQVTTRRRDVDQLFSIYDTVLRNVADQRAPMIVVRWKPNCSNDGECRATRRECRVLEARYRRTRSPADCRVSVDSTLSRLRHRSQKEKYRIGWLEACGRSSTKIWKTMSPLLGRNRDVTGATSHTADGLAVFFARVRFDTAGLPPPPIIDGAMSFTSFRSCLQEEVDNIVMSSVSPNKSSSFDP